MQEDKNKIEALLFTTGRFLGLDELSNLSGMGSVGYLKDLLNKLKEDYEKRDSSLEIINQGDKWKLNIKKQYLFLTESLLNDTEFDGATQETLAVIAYKNPALQSEIIKIRGNGAYDHIKILKDLDFIAVEPSGRTKILKLTTKFYDYFDVVENQLKSKMSLVHNQETTNGEQTNETTTKESEN
ncbi:MAG TPA: SMC-Scp complex subunit ScpB [Candidatus Nanoarchaeia archaeon]|nr:SMC-Scp complex subunit ScpB [Candidatus Nanoarchaeia archaeon]